jgi:hypothetical protein
MFNLPRIALDSFRFAEPLYLWLLVLPCSWSGPGGSFVGAVT